MDTLRKRIALRRANPKQFDANDVGELVAQLGELEGRTR